MNLPGVGPKTAAKLIETYGSADAVLAHADELTPKLRQNVLASADAIAVARKLVTLDRSVPVALDLDTLRFAGPSAAVRPIFAELGFNRMLDQLDDMGVTAEAAPSTAAPPAAAPRPSAHEPTTAADFEYRCVNTPDALDRLVVGRTVLVIAHRLRLAQRADGIVVLDAGHVVETGIPADLLATDGPYRRFVEDHGPGVDEPGVGA